MNRRERRLAKNTKWEGISRDELFLLRKNPRRFRDIVARPTQHSAKFGNAGNAPDGGKSHEDAGR